MSKEKRRKKYLAVFFYNLSHQHYLYLYNNTQYKQMYIKLPHKISIDQQFHDLFKTACSQLNLERPSRIQPAKYKNHTAQEIYIIDLKSIFRNTPTRMAEYKKILLICKDILADCNLIDRKSFTFEQLIQYMPVVKATAQEGSKLEIVKSELRKIQDLSKQKIPQYEKHLKQVKELSESQKTLLLTISNLKKEPKELNKLKNLELEYDSLLQNNRLITNMLAFIKEKGISQTDIQNASLISDKGLSNQLTLFLRFLQSYFVDLSNSESPFLKVISCLSQDKPISEIKKYMDLLPKTQSAIVKPLVQKVTKNQKTTQQTGPLFELDKIKSSQKELKAKIEQLQYNLQIAESQRQQMINKNEQLALELDDQKSDFEKKIKSETKSIEQKYLKIVKKLNQQIDDYKNKVKGLEDENSRLNNNLKNKNQKIVNRQGERETARIIEENKDLRKKIREMEDRLDRQISEKQIQIDRIFREKNDLARKVSYEPPKNGEADPLLLQYKGQCEQFTLELDRQKQNHAKLQEFLTKLQRQLRNNENEIISKLRANQKKARKNYSELEALNRAQVEEIKKLSAQISLEKEANRKAQELKAELNTLRELYNEMKEKCTRIFAGDGQGYQVGQQKYLVRQKSRK